MTVCLFVRLFLYLSNCISEWLAKWLFLCSILLLSECLFVLRLANSQLINLSFYMSIDLSNCRISIERYFYVLSVMMTYSFQLYREEQNNINKIIILRHDTWRRILTFNNKHYNLVRWSMLTHLQQPWYIGCRRPSR